ncbi:UDP-glucose 4-epimerase isoform X2 [Eurytemora carolleeae]|uniref:UDP-glucose 4-epimerase isoform X2 n=1 Tax=Eurytemora carolleeae TaxID=1294199 RepID=UPI000C792B3E|nr:UDP-glucose 4-epimerase isoform X2 [Eurytemora carolleeae]|eukprot:XP_023319779.1 UDP-glucose 4-epimerase-like isoform X2 [Eurytemora affinis]
MRHGEDRRIGGGSEEIKMAGTGKTILVTGGAGYVGSHTVIELLKEEYNVIVVDNFVNSIKVQSGKGNIYPESLSRVQQLTGKKVVFHEVDICNKHALRTVFSFYHSGEQKIDCVIHFAALKAVGESCALPLKYYGNNVTGSANLMEVMMEFGVKRLVFSSSATVYGQPQYLPVDENHPTGNCTNPYGKTKFFMEEIMKDVVAANPDWGCQLLRYFNPVGAHPSGCIGEDPQGIPNNLMPYIAQVAVGRREKLMVYGSDYDTEDGTGCRDYIHVMDLAMGHVAAIRQILDPTYSGLKIYNLGTGRGQTVLQMVKAFSEVSGREIPYELVDRRPGDVASCYASCELAAKELGWRSKLSLEDMCSSEYKWQLSNPTGYRS